MPITKKKIIYIITKGNWGGAQRYVFDLASHLPRDEYEPLVAMGAGVGLAEKLATAGVRTEHLSLLSETRRVWLRNVDIGAIFELVRLLKRERPDIVHLNSSRASLLGIFASCLYQLSTFNFRLATIFTVHGWPFKEPRARIIRICIYVASYITALFAKQTIVLSLDDYRRGKRMLGVGKKVSLIYNGVKDGVPLSRVEAREKLFGKATNEFWIGTIAELNRNKGIPTLIEAMTLLPKDVRLCLIGEGEDRKKLETLVSWKGLSERVLFTGALSNASAYLPAFDIFTLPSLKEGLPYTILEAGARGIPVVGTNISGTRDIIDSQRVGILVPPKDATALRDALFHIKEGKETREALGRALHTRVATVFSFDRMLKNTLALYARATA